EWHALAKLRLHTECTLNFLSQSTVTIGRELCSFKEWTQVFKTVKLPGEADARDWRCRCRKPAPNALEADLQQANKSPTQLKTKLKKKLFNLFTYKLHALGDYVSMIRLFGTTDSYSTQIVSLGLSAPLDTAFNFLAG
ncbi:hypothetical protein L208DRAFT_1243225, partial [Tricholoma matsutake]